jgi:ketosteroid isomerase-like protein
MSEESTTPDLVGLTRTALEALNRRDLDAMTSFFAPDCVWDTPEGVLTFDGRAAIRGFLEDWIAAYEEFDIDAEEILDLGNEVTFAIFNQRGRLVGSSSSEVRFRSASAAVWADGLQVRVSNYLDIDEARATAERLAQERG